jgi:hypothetical protein
MTPSADINEIRAMVERVVGEVLESRMAEIRHAVVDRVEGELQPLLVQQEGAAALLNVAVNAMQASVSQADILDSILDGATNFAGRAAMFIVRPARPGDKEEAAAWHARGIDENALRSAPLALDSGLAAEVIRTRRPHEVPVGQQLGALTTASGALLLPLVLRDKVAALLYVDSGASSNEARGRRIDRHALELLIRSAGLWLEVVATRRTTKPSAAGAAESVASEAATQPAAHTETAGASVAEPVHPMVAPPERVEHAVVANREASQPEIGPTEKVEESAAALTGAEAAAAISPEPDFAGSSAISSEEVHRKARRFARLLVDEIKLYNQEQVAQGRENRDLYERLKEDIEKSRAAYERRYGSTAAASADYFQQELVRSLADNDPELLGATVS